jgi:hypothetical protein
LAKSEASATAHHAEFVGYTILFGLNDPTSLLKSLAPALQVTTRAISRGARFLGRLNVNKKNDSMSIERGLNHTSNTVS